MEMLRNAFLVAYGATLGVLSALGGLTMAVALLAAVIRAAAKGARDGGG